jgi:hypothetical protein
MSYPQSSTSEPNRILAYSLKRPLLVTFSLYILAWVIKYFDTSVGMQAGTEFGPFLALFLGGYVLLIPIIALVTNRLKPPEVKPWGEFS